MISMAAPHLMLCHTPRWSAGVQPEQGACSCMCTSNKAPPQHLSIIPVTAQPTLCPIALPREGGVMGNKVAGATMGRVTRAAHPVVPPLPVPLHLLSINAWVTDESDIHHRLGSTTSPPPLLRPSPSLSSLRPHHNP